MTTMEEAQTEESPITAEVATEDTQTTTKTEGNDSMNGTATVTSEATAIRTPRPKRPNYHKLHARPMPLSVYPIPSFLPNNPLSLFRIAYLVLRDWVSPPSPRATIYNGYLSVATQSVHVTDPATVRALWEMGFFGTGTLSRSEPNWLDMERRRLGLVASMTAEEVTTSRRNVRMEFKRERARLEREALEEQKRKESAGATGSPSPSDSEVRDSSVQILAGSVDVPGVEEREVEKTHVPEPQTGKPQAEGLQAQDVSAMQTEESNLQHVFPHMVSLPQIPYEALIEVEQKHNVVQEPNLRHVFPHVACMPQALCEVSTKVKEKHDSAQETSEDEDVQDVSSRKEPAKSIKMRDSVQEPLEDEAAQEVSQLKEPIEAVENHDSAEDLVEEEEPHIVHTEELISQEQPQMSFAKALPKEIDVENEDAEQAPKPKEPVNQEHLQLSLAEAFYLSYALGALKVLDPESQTAIDENKALLQRFRQNSYFPPVSADQTKPDDPFLLSYVVYHHFRSLGWVVREGIKFAVDFLLYERGPVFTHATFAIMIVPSYTDAYWRATPERAREVEKRMARKSWHWLHCANRVQGHVIKTLILVYVDVPAPLENEESEKDIGKMLQRYKIREFTLRRWSPNRNRD